MTTWGKSWGTFRWGASKSGGASYKRGAVNSCKDDTRFLARSETGSFAELSNDLSEFGDLTDATTYAYKNNDTDRAFTGERCIYLRVSITSIESGTYALLGVSTSDYQWRAYPSTNQVRFGVGGSEVSGLRLFPPNLSGTARTVIIVWSTEPNPDTTGASDAMLSTTWAYDEATGDTVMAGPVAHADITADGTDEFIIGAGTNTGTGTLTGTMLEAHVGNRFRHLSEVLEDLVSRTPYPTIVGRARLELPSPGPSTGIADDGQFAHPYQLASVGQLRNDMRLLSPVWNVVVSDPQTITEADANGDAAFLGDFNGAGFASTGMLVCRPVPPHVTHVRVRAWLYMENISSAAVGLRCYSANRLPVVGGLAVGPGTPFNFRYTEVIADYSDGTHLVDLGTLPVVRNASGLSFFWLALDNIDEDADFAYALLAWSGEPLILAPQSTGIPSDITTP